MRKRLIQTLPISAWKSKFTAIIVPLFLTFQGLDEMDEIKRNEHLTLIKRLKMGKWGYKERLNERGGGGYQETKGVGLILPPLFFFFSYYSPFSDAQVTFASLPSSTSWLSSPIAS